VFLRVLFVPSEENVFCDAKMKKGWFLDVEPAPDAYGQNVLIQ
jgi:hypothetical protein